jgi:hypothetical protein
MFDVELVREILGNILVAARRIERRFATISAPTDLLDSDDGVDRLDILEKHLLDPLDFSARHWPQRDKPCVVLPYL